MDARGRRGARGPLGGLGTAMGLAGQVRDGARRAPCAGLELAGPTDGSARPALGAGGGRHRGAQTAHRADGRQARLHAGQPDAFLHQFPGAPVRRPQADGEAVHPRHGAAHRAASCWGGRPHALAGPRAGAAVCRQGKVRKEVADRRCCAAQRQGGRPFALAGPRPRVHEEIFEEVTHFAAKRRGGQPHAVAGPRPGASVRKQAKVREEVASDPLRRSHRIEEACEGGAS
mmetsp:Transcript_48031/g.138324  ORF Transcript_48031/g.138324 Transcript_48031/m.138324 type:complete len:230 (-) Transcript_48031:458-1147(-)